jgi:hypothetical protein
LPEVSPISLDRNVTGRPISANRFVTHLSGSDRHLTDAQRAAILELCRFKMVVRKMAHGDEYSSAVISETGPPLVAAPRTWLLCVGWKRARAA